MSDRVAECIGFDKRRVACRGQFLKSISGALLVNVDEFRHWCEKNPVWGGMKSGMMLQCKECGLLRIRSGGITRKVEVKAEDCEPAAGELRACFV